MKKKYIIKEKAVAGDGDYHGNKKRFVDTVYFEGGSDMQIEVRSFGRSRLVVRYHVEFIAEYFNGFNQTGKTYSELLEERNKFYSLCQKLIEAKDKGVKVHEKLTFTGGIVNAMFNIQEALKEVES